MVYTLRLFISSICSLFHNSDVFYSCIIHILYTGCAKIKKKFLRQKFNVAACDQRIIFFHLMSVCVLCVSPHLVLRYSLTIDPIYSCNKTCHVDHVIFPQADSTECFLSLSAACNTEIKRIYILFAVSLY